MIDGITRDNLKYLEDRSIDLLIESYSNSARVIQVRGLTRNEQISTDHTTNADRSLASSTIDITDMPISLLVKAVATGVKRGECYVRVSLRIEGVVVAVLTAGYVFDTQHLAFPNGIIESSISGPGLIRTIVGTDPAAGVEISETVPTGARWKVRSIFFEIVCDATVASRGPRLSFDDGANVFNKQDTFKAPTAGTTGTFSGALIWTNRSAGADNGVGTFGLPDIELKAGYRMRTITVALQAGDNYGAPIFEVEEWIEP